MLIDDLDVRIIHAATGEIIRHLTLDPNRRYHGTGQPTGGPDDPTDPEKRNNRTLNGGSDCPDVSRHHMARSEVCESQDIPDTVAGHGGHHPRGEARRVLTLAGVNSPSCDHCCRRRGPPPERGRRRPISVVALVGL